MKLGLAAAIATVLCLPCSAADMSWAKQPHIRVEYIYGADETLPSGCWSSVWWLENVGCTVVFVGEDVFLTSRHCIDNKANQYDLQAMEPYSFEFGSYQTSSRWKCHRLEDNVLDVGVCLRESGDPSPECYETVDLDTDNIKEKRRVYAVGASYFSHDDGAIRRGVDASWLTVDGVDFDQSNLVLASKGGACRGDSGGPILTKHSSARKLVALIHKGGCEKTGFVVTALSGKKVSEYLTGWSAVNKVGICGINWSSDKCVTTW